MLTESTRSEIHVVIPESWYKYGARRALGIPNFVVYSYFTDEYRNRSAVACLLICRVAEAEFAALSLGAFLREVQLAPDSCFAQDQMMGACAGRSALLRVPGVLVIRWFGFQTTCMLKYINVDLVLALFKIVSGAEVDCHGKSNLDRLPSTFAERVVSFFPLLALLRRISTSGERIEDGGMPMRIREYREVVGNRGMSKE